MTEDEFFAQCEAAFQRLQRALERIGEDQAETFRILQQGIAALRHDLCAGIDRLGALFESALVEGPVKPEGE